MPAQPYGTGQQQPYGTYPTQPQPQMPGGGPGDGGAGGGGKSKQRLMIIVSAVVAVALIAAAGIFFLTKKDDSEDDPKPKPTASGTQGGGTGGKDVFKEQPAPQPIDAKALVKVPMPKTKKGELVRIDGIWATDKVFAKASAYAIVGYPANGGSKALWTRPLDGEMCWASPHVNDKGQTAIVFKEAKPTKKEEYPGCTEVGLLDLNSGKLVWQKHANGSTGKATFNEVTISGDTVAAGSRYDGGGWAWSTSGDELWAPRGSDECEDQGYAGDGKKLVRVRMCGATDTPQVKVERIDPKTGETQSEYTVPQGIDDVHVASVDPLVIGVEAGESKSNGASDFFVLNDSEKTATLRSKISTENGKYSVGCGSYVEDCHGVAVSRQTDKLFMATEKRYSSSGPSNEVVAFSLESGKAVGKADGVPEVELTPLMTDENGYVIALQQAAFDRGGVVLRIDPKSYDKAVLMNLPLESAALQRRYAILGDNELAYVNGRLFMGESRVLDPDGETPLAVGFGG
ncbi:hypothetical protein [Streptomyces sp. XD-27]|uniref:hypothetical protein n=1 Tax=Streptomyces sp. XD-27 TaxID=3062779 RepID=UPI0026F415E2|nr:hypothetical protein [Streptomyces sp. XD-27]WKX72236.1 hypothetical protein Q3Y56_22120 [Streptomyces sp. XD-27]